MFNHRFDETPGKIVVLHWFLLSFNGGCINAGGFLTTGRFVSHVTGFATLFGVSWTREGLPAALGILSVPLFFLLGSFLAGLLIDGPIHRNLKPHFDWVMGLCAFCLVSAAAGQTLFLFRSFGDFGANENYLLLALLCLASGLQNGAITSSSGSSVRSTHLTGLTTDLGLGLAKLVTFNSISERFRHEARANYLRAGSIFSFIAGSAAGAAIFIRFGYTGFFLPAMIAAYTAWHGRKAKIVIHR